jgi:alpha(1,3/1,4) fucosyltransferase
MLHLKIMMRICLFSEHINEEIFNLNNEIVNRDNCMYSFSILKKEFEKRGYDFSTQEINPKDKSDIILYMEMPKDLPKGSDFYKSYLLLFETELIRPDNWILEYHQKFNKIFTWRDDFVDNKKYFKINWTHLFSELNTVNGMYERKLCTLIAGNKSSIHPLELYSKRKEAIRWFENNHPEEFDLYGVNWKSNWRLNKLLKYSQLQRLVQSINNIFDYNPSYKGKIKNKSEILKHYKYCICYENAQNIPGYITEKIFDCFIAGCVPIYWGANNVEDHIPTGTFIDKRKFSTYAELYEYIKYMSLDDYSHYIENIHGFLKSEKIIQFTPEWFSKTIIKEITGKD